MFIDKNIWTYRLLTSYLFFVISSMYFVLVGSRAIWLLSVIFLLPFCYKNITTLSHRLLKSYTLLIVLLWCFISSFWSYWGVFARTETFLQCLIFLTALLISELYKPETIFTVLKNIAILCIGLLLISLILNPSAISSGFVGFYAGKNTTGQFLALSCLILFFRQDKTKLTIFTICIGLMLLLLTRSGTAIIMFIVSVSVGYFFRSITESTASTIKKFLLRFGPLFLLIIFATTYLYRLELLEFIYNNLEDDFLTGRGKLWTTMLMHAEDRIVTGFGYASVWWHGDYSEIYFTDLVLYNTEWADNLGGSDSGYVDLVISIGLIGTFIFFAFLYNTLINILKVEQPIHRALYIAFFTYIVLSSITESAFLVPQFYLWFLLLLIFCMSIQTKNKSNYVC